MKNIQARVSAHFKTHWRKYAVELALLVPLFVLHSPVLFAAIVAGVTGLIIFRERVLHHAKRHHLKLIGLALVLSLLYLCGIGYHPNSGVAPVVIGPAAAQPAPDPFAGKGIDGIKSSGVDQRAVGDCFYESGLAALANTARGRAIIYQSIVVNRDASYTVTFAGAPDEPVQVFQSDLKLTYSKGWARDSALWARIMETAFLKYEHAESFGTGIYSKQEEGIPDAAPVPPGGETQALALLTGQDVATDAFSFVSGDSYIYHLGYTSAANLEATLKKALRAGEPVTLRVADASLAKWGFNDPGPLDTDHIFSLLRIKNGIVTTRNPWGFNSAPFNIVKTKANAKTYKPVDGITALPDGELQMSVKTLMSFYSSINFAGDNPTTNDLRNVDRDIEHGQVWFFLGDSLFTVTDVTDRSAINVGGNVWHGMKRLYNGAASIF